MPTGFRPLDKAIGLNGLPRGIMTELVAPGATVDRSGTMCIAARIAAKAQRQQQLVTVVDLEQQFDTWLAERSGLMTPQLLTVYPETLFDALTTIEDAARHHGLVVVMLGVVAQLLHHVEPGPLRTLMRRLRTIIRQSHSAFLFVTVPVDENPFDPGNYPNGFYLADLADVRLWVQEENWTYKAGMATNYRANVTVIKNRLAAMGTGADIRIKFNQ